MLRHCVFYKSPVAHYHLITNLVVMWFVFDTVSTRVSGYLIDKHQYMVIHGAELLANPLTYTLIPNSSTRTDQHLEGSDTIVFRNLKEA